MDKNVIKDKENIKLSYPLAENLDKHKCGFDSDGKVFGIDNTKFKKGIYILYDKDNKIIYIGKTGGDIKSRLWAHISPNNSKRESLGSYPYNSSVPLGAVKYYSYIECDDNNEIALMEKLYFLIYKPKYNKLK